VSGSAGTARRFRFVQFEFPFVLGPAPGRYVIRDHADEAALRVLVVAGLGAPERRLLGRRRARAVAPEPAAAPVPTTRVTVIRGHPVDDAGAAEWLREPGGHVDPELAVLNRVLHLHRIAAADPTVRPVAAAGATAVRVGHGLGEEVAGGRWTEAVTPPPPGAAPRRGRREEALRPQERLAALLGGRDAPLAAEALALDARAARDGGRDREAALLLRVALEAALAELAPWGGTADLAARLDELGEARGAVGGAANAALAGGLDPGQVADVERVLARVEAALRARTANLG
jgi:hypothetical protein